MRKILTLKSLSLLFTLWALLFAPPSFCQSNQRAFNVNLGGGISYSVLNYTTGFTGKIGLEAFEQFRLIGNYTHYLKSFEQSGSGKLNKTAYEFDALMQYLVETSDRVKIYFSAGFNRYHKTLEYNSGKVEQFDYNRIKLGSGLQVEFNQVALFGDYHFAGGTQNDHGFTMGLLVYLL